MSELSGSVQLDDAMVGTAPRYKSYLSAASSLRPGLLHLTTGDSGCDEAITLIAGFVAESSIKAALAKAGIPEVRLKAPRDLGHDLVKLWEEAKTQGVLVGASCPDWVAALNAFHAHPYFIRYNTVGGFYSMPPSSLLVPEVLSLYEAMHTYCYA